MNDHYIAKQEEINENTQALESFLRGGGFVHYVAESIAEALQIARKNIPRTLSDQDKKKINDAILLQELRKENLVSKLMDDLIEKPTEIELFYEY